MSGRPVGSGAYRAVRGLAVRVLGRWPPAMAAARALLPRGRGRRLSQRVGSGGVRLNIRAGRFMDDEARRQLPIVVIVATGRGSANAERLAATVERAQVLAGSFRPLFVIDHGMFAPFRMRGFAVEHVMSESAFAAVRPHDSYAEYVYGRVASITRSYGARSVVPVDAGGLSDPESLRLIGAVGPSGPRG